ncbi:uncharacterized protein B0H18DRAFT_981599 [Fomitopsis serialis]|uniref:uncharacterized protein n=1 Tax=Fomitopsis serialis TaxID=139415 RepID=UPI002008AFA0|nr:uncharacterized protein B0H18DRAFT_981599 [Neoantrodia serialis]KAH9934390.1 hypothetical protein B0H18DRAFT_981599 [Neoantrodia serialis]
MSGEQTPVLNRPTPVSQSIFQQTYGGSLACCQIMLVFYGLSVLQSYLYFIRYEKDRIYLRLLVLVLFCLSTVHSIFVCHTVWHYLVFSYTDVALLTDGEWSVYAATTVGVVTCFLVQCFFARTLYQLLKGRWRLIITTVMIVLILAQLGFGITLSYKLFQIWQLYLLKEAVYISMIPLFCVRMAADAVTATTLCVALYETTTDFRSSVKLIKMLIMYAVNRFVLTTVVVAVQTIVLIVRPGEIWAMVLEFITVHIYVNSLLATLNARDHLRHIGTGSSMAIESRVPTGRSALVFRSGPIGRFDDTLDESSGATTTEHVHVDLLRSLDRPGGRDRSFELGDLDKKIKASETADNSDRLV